MEGLSGSGVIMQSHMERQKMERPDIIMEDHGETIHDGNFCMDGLVYPDRTPHTDCWNIKMSIVR